MATQLPGARPSGMPRQREPSTQILAPERYAGRRCELGTDVGREMQERGGGKWVLNYRRNDKASVQLFCFPYAGGSAASFRTRTEKLPGMFELWSVELPGRGRRYQEIPERRIEALVPPLARALRSAIDRPFALFGHSMGAILGFEASYALLATGLRPVVLIVSGQRGGGRAGSGAGRGGRARGSGWRRAAGRICRRGGRR
jgi:pimeloyl-ACP methyl ester carboxylesterase